MIYRRRTSSRSRDSGEMVGRYGRDGLDIPNRAYLVVADRGSPPNPTEDETEAENHNISIDDVAVALGLAAAGGHAEVVEEMLKAKEEIKNRETWFQIPLTNAVEFGHDNIVKHIISEIGLGTRTASAGEGLGRCLLSASKLGHISIVKILLNLGVEVNSQDAH